MKKYQPESKPEAPSPNTVCGHEMTADILWYPNTKYQMGTIYFCTEFCLEAFQADPDRFYKAHRQQKDNAS
jgi:YHS domain-containing protein